MFANSPRRSDRDDNDDKDQSSPCASETLILVEESFFKVLLPSHQPNLGSDSEGSVAWGFLC